jgi:MYXO-CTERM domain-containing protein
MLALGISWGAVQIHPYLQPMGLGALLIAILVGRRRRSR